VRAPVALGSAQTFTHSERRDMSVVAPFNARESASDRPAQPSCEKHAIVSTGVASSVRPNAPWSIRFSCAAFHS